MSPPAYARAPGVVWRLADDRVLVRRVGASGDDAAADLLGAAAVVWVALDEERTIGELVAEVAEAVGSVSDADGGAAALLEEAVAQLLTRGFVVEAAG